MALYLALACPVPDFRMKEQDAEGYTDHGKLYTTNQLRTALARLGIRELHAKPRACQSKGKIEKFHQKADQFIAEIRVAKVHSLEELNQKWKYFLEQDYQKEAHDGIKEYYESHGVQVPAEEISPYQEFMRDTSGLVFLDTAVVSEAFLHHETRKLDNAGCFSFGDVKYEASAALANAEAEIAYDPMNTDTIKVLYRDMEPVFAHRVRIDAFCDKTPPLPIGMTDKVPETSRILDALEKKYKEEHHLMADALSFGEYGKAGGAHV